MTSPANERLVIAAATYRRTELLTALLPRLRDQVAELGPGVRARILIVDNDPAGGAREVVEQGAHPEVVYVHEAEPGISAARNRALAEAAEDDVLLFLDDDEIPGPGWAGALLACWRTYRCTAVAGPVIPSFAGPVDRWVRASGVFERRIRPTGTVIRGAASNNLLLDMAALRSFGLRFDPRYGLSGGSDTLLTYQITAYGGEIRWCDEAEVTDLIPADRARKAWVRRRLFRTSGAWARVHLELAGPGLRQLAARGRMTWRAVVRGGKGVLELGRGLLARDPDLRTRGECDLISSAALLTGAFGLVRYEYRRG